MLSVSYQFSVGRGADGLLLIPLYHENLAGDIDNDTLGWQGAVLSTVGLPGLGAQAGQEYRHHTGWMHRQP